MLGKSGERRAALGVFVSCVALAVSCAHNVPQDSATGEDGKIKGAKPMVLENGEARVSGIVTYPGGDRVDWKVIELPDKAKGTLDLKLQWTPPRPGLMLAFDVFDEWNHPLTASKKNRKEKRGGRVRTATLEHAKGTYFIRVYAVGRGDAGKYKLSAEFKEDLPPLVFDPMSIEIPLPPKLAAVPEPEAVCDEFAFDVKNPACRVVCPKVGAPPGWPACAGVCPTPPDINVPSCWATMPCPTPADRRVKACKTWPPCDLKNPDQGNPRCDNAKPEPVTARVLRNEIQGNDTIITIAIGTKFGVTKDWTGVMVRDNQPVPGGEVTIFRVTETFSVGKVHLTPDQLKNATVKLSPP
jgi:hypothetical protein